MLNSITLKNFRQHRDLSLTFGAGMTAIRGANENGKTTVLEAVAYAMFGVKAVRDSLEDTVTWGEPANTLSVAVQMVVDGVVYDIKRGKSGAEVNYDGGIVTGQTEVSNFVAKLLKVDATTAARLTMSNQGEIRGALESGTKATTELIERLAEFDQIDKLLELMQEKLTLGSPTTAEATIVAARATLERLEGSAAPVNFDDLTARISQLTSDSVGLEQLVHEAGRQEVAAQEAHGQVRERIVQRASLVRDAERCAGAVKVLQGEIDAPLPVAPDNVEERVAVMEKRILEASNAVDYRGLHEVFQKFSTTPSGFREVWDLPYIEAMVVDETKALSELNLRAAILRGDAGLLKQQLLQGTCTFCGKDFSGVPEVAARNAELTERLQALDHMLEGIQPEYQALTKSLEVKKALVATSAPVLRALGTLKDVAELADDRLPPYLRWTGPEVFSEPPDTAALKRQIRQLKQEEAAYLAAGVALAALAGKMIRLLAECADANVALVALPEETISAAQQILDGARAERHKANTLYNDARSDLKGAERDLKDQQDAQKRAAQALKDAKASVAKLEEQLATLEFNNALLKRVRQARPVIADKLWGIVLTAVSSYFSEIRGVPSTVSKDKEGFKVDEHSVTSMSGSTLDALGLAIRVALVRTFLPNAAFLLLDEPAAAMDEARTGSMLGFLATCGFSQVLLCSHDPLSESVADHVVALDAQQ